MCIHYVSVQNNYNRPITETVDHSHTQTFVNVFVVKCICVCVCTYTYIYVFDKSDMTSGKIRKMFVRNYVNRCNFCDKYVEIFRDTVYKCTTVFFVVIYFFFIELFETRVSIIRFLFCCLVFIVKFSR